MKIDHRVLSYELNKHLAKSTQNVPEDVLEKPSGNEPKAGESTQSIVQDTVVHLSQARKEVRLIQETIAGEPSIRDEKVAAIKEKIESGKYKIDHEIVADRIIDAFMEDLL